MTLVDSQLATRSCTTVLGTEAAHRVPARARDLVTSGGTSGLHQKPWSTAEGLCRFAGCCIEVVKKEVCTMCTPRASNSVGLGSDGAVLGRFSGVGYCAGIPESALVCRERMRLCSSPMPSSASTWKSWSERYVAFTRRPRVTERIRAATVTASGRSRP